jgi:alkylhydroperoxidase family enzyme
MFSTPTRLVPPHEPDPETAGLIALTAPPGRDAPGTIAVLGHAPALLGPFLGWAAALALQGRLPERDHELLALRAAYNCRSPFEWGEHAELARGAGIDDDELARIAAGPDAAGWTPVEVALLRAADELHAAASVDDSTWTTLAAHYDDAQLVELLYVVGQYTMLSFVANAAGVPVPDDLDELPD